MNKQPISYLQTDSKWKNVDYSAKGESTTIGASGCGPTAMSMVLATLVDSSITPKTECAWALAHGYKAPHQGTYYGYFKPAAARYGLEAYMLNGSSLYGNSTSSYHAKAKELLLNGHYVIACMGKGLWTSSGHFVLVWHIDGNTIYINDPNSTKTARTKGDYSLFKQQVKYYFPIKIPTVTQKEDELGMTIDEFLGKLTPEQAYLIAQRAEQYSSTIAEPDWSKQEGHWSEASEQGVVSGSPERYLKRDEMIAIMGRKGLLD